MAVYIDDAHISARVGRHNTHWCHLSADTQEELHTFAESIGLKRAWFQSERMLTWHYDVTANKRKQAVAAGAIECTSRQMARWMFNRRQGDPRDC